MAERIGGGSVKFVDHAFVQCLPAGRKWRLMTSD
jgi:hypothetical protein